jgi:hypothetical protein
MGSHNCHVILDLLVGNCSYGFPEYICFAFSNGLLPAAPYRSDDLKKNLQVHGIQSVQIHTK